VNGLNLTFDDAAPASVPSPIVSGTWRPTNIAGYSDTFPSPAPAGPYGSSLSAFNGLDPGGTWSLYLNDGTTASGSISGGWSLTIETADGTTGDYVGKLGTLTFPAGVTTQAIAVTVNADLLDELDPETFLVNLTNPTNASIADGQGQGTILDDDPTPTLSIGDTTVTEGSSGTTNAVLTTVLSAPSGRTVTVGYATADGTATGGGAIVYNPAAVGISIGSSTGSPYPSTISVPAFAGTVSKVEVTLNNLTYSYAQFLDILLVGPAGQTVMLMSDVGGDASNVTLTFADDAPTSIGFSTLVSGRYKPTNSDTTTDSFPSPAPSGPYGTLLSAFNGISPVGTWSLYLFHDFQAYNGSISGGWSIEIRTTSGDFISTSGTLTIPPGAASGTLTVPVFGDTAVEADETFFVNLTSPVNATLADAQGAVTITTDDFGLSIGDVTVNEGNAGTTDAIFTVSLSGASAQTVTVSYATAAGTTGGGGTYANATSISIPSSGNATPYPSTIPVPASGPIAKVTATLTGFSHTWPADVDVLLVGPAGQTVVLMSDVGGSTTVTGLTLTFDDAGAVIPATLPSDTSVTYQPADISPGDAFSPPAPAGPYGTALSVFNGTNPAGTWSLYVVDDVGGDSGTITGGWSLTIETTGGDYAAASGTLTFAPGTTAQTITVAVNGDTTFEPDETFFVNLSGATGAVILDGQGLGTILNDDLPAALSIDDRVVTEGNAGTISAGFTVTLSSPAAETVTVAYATADVTATAGSDYLAASGVLTFTPGATTQSIGVAVNGDMLDEPDETFVVNLSAPTNATIADAQAVGTIADDDPPPSLSINDVTVTEGNSGTVNAVFTVTLSGLTAQAVTVDYATADGSAAAGTDYVPTSGTLTFTPGTTTQPISVTANGDAVFEPNEVFFVNLSAAANAGITDAQGQGTITNDDLAPPTLDPVLGGAITVGGTTTLTGTGFTTGTVIKLFVNTGDSIDDVSPGGFTPASWTSTSLTWNVPSTVPLGQGFGSIFVVNTDQGFTTSNTVYTHLYGDAAENIPTITAINGTPLSTDLDPGVPVAHTDTVVTPGATVTIAGTGFYDPGVASPGVAIFAADSTTDPAPTPNQCAVTNYGGLFPAGSTSTSITFPMPSQVPPGPANFRVVNAPYAGNVLSNSVSAVAGSQVTISSVSLSGDTVTVLGTGFSCLSVINLFNLQGSTVVNLGGLTGGGQRVIPLQFISSQELRFLRPAGAQSGPAFVEVLNPPYIPYSSSGADPNGGFSFP
jgi:subtilisin-like proprotein convertase family protein